MLCSEDSIFDINITPCVDGRKGKTFIMEYVQILCFYLFKKIRQTLLIMTELAASRYYFETQFIFPQSFVSFRHEMLFVWFIVCFILKVDCNQGAVTSDCFIGNVIVNHK